VLREQEAMVGWCTLFCNVVVKDVPADAMPEAPEDRELNHWWKSKKWAYANLNRLFVRQGSHQCFWLRFFANLTEDMAIRLH